MLVGTQSSPLTVSTSQDHDLFLFWLSSCTKNGSKVMSIKDAQEFKVTHGTNVHETSRADFCSLRFDAKLFTQYLALSASGKQTVLYDSRDSVEKEHRLKVDYPKLVEIWRNKHVEDSAPADTPDIFSQSNNDQSQGSYYGEYQTSNTGQQVEDPLWNQFRTGQILTRRRFKRHVGTHDGGGIQRVISTGTLVDTLKNKTGFRRSSSIDVVYATFWFPPSQNVKLMSPEMRSCFDKYLNLDYEGKIRLSGQRADMPRMDHDAYEELVAKICAEETNEPELSSKQKYDVYNRKMGALTVYRQTLSCADGGDIQPMKRQIWPSYMGQEAASYANWSPSSNHRVFSPSISKPSVPKY